MGAHPYYYFVEYQADVDAALQDLRQREFEAGRYNPAQPFPQFPIRFDRPTPGARHDTIGDALEEAAEDGTRSILDIDGIAFEPEYCMATPFPEESLELYFGTAKPTKEIVSRSMGFLEAVDRGHCVYFTVFKDGEPSELFFAGYSFD
jgi:hypothetical protein